MHHLIRLGAGSDAGSAGGSHAMVQALPQL
jgi:hypothetical protein